jgi:hypothetical protein
MSRGFGLLERRIIELLAGPPDDGRTIDEFIAARGRVLSVGDICDAAFNLKGKPASRAQRLSATRAAHRLLAHAGTAAQNQLATIRRVISETEAALGRPPDRREILWSAGDSFIGVDRKFAEAMRTAPSWPAWQRSWEPARRLDRIRDWRETQTADRRLWFHSKYRPVRIWAVSVQPAGVIWADTELVRVTERNVIVRYAGDIARLDRYHLARSWVFWRGVMFVSSRTGRIAEHLDAMWQERYGRHTAGGVPPIMQMRLAEARALLGVPADYTEEDVKTAFRHAAKKAHPDLGGTAADAGEIFRKLVEARDRLLKAIGTSAPPPKMPAYYPSGTQIRYRTVRRATPSRLGHTRRLGYTRRLTG